MRRVIDVSPLLWADCHRVAEADERPIAWHVTRAVNEAARGDLAELKSSHAAVAGPHSQRLCVGFDANTARALAHTAKRAGISEAAVVRAALLPYLRRFDSAAVA